MKELTTDEMSSLKGGQPFNIAALVAVDNVAAAVPVNINSGVQDVGQLAVAAAGNQVASITQIANSGVLDL